MPVPIPLHNGMVAWVDAQDFPKVSGMRWLAIRRFRVWYAGRSVRSEKTGRSGILLMHQVILPGCKVIDHRDSDGLNNVRDNLRPATRAENCRNTRKSRRGRTSKYKGVSLLSKRGKFQATIRYNYQQYYLGIFQTEEAAAWAYDREARLRFGSFARCNFPPPPMVIPGGAA